MQDYARWGWSILGLVVGSYFVYQAVYPMFLTDEQKQEASRKREELERRRIQQREAVQAASIQSGVASFFSSQTAADILAAHEAERVAREIDKAERAKELAVERQFRAQQDAEYEEGLAADRRKVQDKQQAKEDAADAEELDQAIELSKQLDEEQQTTRQMEELAIKISTIPEEPEGLEKTVMLSIRIRSSRGGQTKFQRRWCSSTNISTLYDYVDVQVAQEGDSLNVEIVSAVIAGQYELRTPFPRTSYSRESGDMTLEDAGIQGQMVLLVEAL